MMPLQCIALKVGIPLTLDDINGLEGDLELIGILVKALNSKLPERQAERIIRIRKLLIDAKSDKTKKWFKYLMPDGTPLP